MSSVTRSSPSVGDQVGPYGLEAILGRGGMGVVYRARHLTSGLVVALKTTAATHESLGVLLRREIAALARLRHPGIVRIVEHGTHQGRPWYAMELLEGVTLWSLFRGARAEVETPTEVDQTRGQTRRASSSPASWWTTTLGHTLITGEDGHGSSQPAAELRTDDQRRDLLGLIARLCVPLAYLHGEGAVHRDLKPENVLVGSDGRPVLVDFGLASRFGGEGHREVLDADSLTAGTVAYMAPEQMTGQFVDARADLYALGVLLFEAVTGRLPFGGSLSDIRAAKLGGDASSLAAALTECPQPLADLIGRLMAPSPRDRPGYSSDVRHVLAEVGIPSSPEGPPPRMHVYRPTFVGRSDELRRLTARVDGLSSGGGGIVALEGVSGSGKTRLATELLRRASYIGVTRLTAECAPPAGAPSEASATPLALFREPVRRVCPALARRDGGAEFLRSAGPLLGLYDPGLSSLLGIEPTTALPAGPDDGQTSEASGQLARAIADLLLAAAETAPLVLALDDLQWADELSLACIGHLAERLRNTRVLMLIAYRAEEVAPPLSAALSQVDAASEGPRLRLEPLSKASVGQIVVDMLALREPPGRFTEFLCRHTDGNPFFVAEYVHAAVAEGVLRRDARATWRFAEGEATDTRVLESLPLPETLEALIELRLARLEPDERRLLAVASVVGRHFEEARLKAVLEREGDDEDLATDEGIARLVGRQILEWDGALRLRFRHDRLLETSYATLTGDDRLRWHRAAAQVLERDAETDAPPSLETAALLARHWAAGGELNKAAQYAISAARQATARGAPGDAYRLLERYLTWTADRPVDEERFEARLDFLMASTETGRDSDEMADIIRALDEEAAALGSDDAKARFKYAQAMHLLRICRYDEAVAAAVEAAELFESTGATALRFTSLHQLGVIRYRQGDYGGAIATLEQALQIPALADDPARLGYGFATLGLALREAGRLGEARDALERGLELMGDAVSARRGVALNHLAGLCVYAGETSRAVAFYQQALSIHRELGARLHEGYTLHDLGEAYLLSGRLEQAAQCYGAAERTFRRVGDTVLMALCTAGRGLALLELGRLDEAQQAADEALAALEPGHRMRGPSLLLAAQVDAARGKLTAAREHLLQVSSESQVTNEARVALARIDLALAAPDQLAELRRRLQALLQPSGTFRDWERGQAELCLARVLRIEGSDLAEARRWLDSAEARFAAAGSRVWSARVECERALLDIADGRPTTPLVAVASLIETLGATPASPLALAYAEARSAGLPAPEA